MKTLPIIPLLAAILMLSPSHPLGMGKSGAAGEVVAVESVDLKRYAGLWHEISRIPNRFQEDCARETTASYTLRDDGKLDIVNRCRDEGGKLIESKGIAKMAGEASNGELKVSFVKFLGFQLFWGDYWIIGLGEDYEYAVVGTPSRKYGWILSREPSLDQAKLAEIYEDVREQGYDPADFEMSVEASAAD